MVEWQNGTGRTGNEQEIAQHCGCCHEYGLGFNGKPHAEEHCELPARREVDAQTALQCSCCHENRRGFNGKPHAKKRCKLPARWGVKATQRNTAEGHRTFPATGVHALHDTANLTLSTHVGAQEAIIMKPVMLIMEHRKKRKREPAKQIKCVEARMAANQIKYTRARTAASTAIE